FRNLRHLAVRGGDLTEPCETPGTIERETLNLWVHGSSPWRVTTKPRSHIHLRPHVTQSCSADRTWVTHGSHGDGGAAWDNLRPRETNPREILKPSPDGWWKSRSLRRAAWQPTLTLRPISNREWRRVKRDQSTKRDGSASAGNE